MHFILFLDIRLFYLTWIYCIRPGDFQQCIRNKRLNKKWRYYVSLRIFQGISLVQVLRLSLQPRQKSKERHRITEFLSELGCWSVKLDSLAQGDGYMWCVGVEPTKSGCDHRRAYLVYQKVTVTPLYF